MDLEGSDMELFMDDDDLADFWAEFVLEGEDEKYRVVVTEDHSPSYSRVNYEIRLSEKRPLSIDDGWTNWIGMDSLSYRGYRESSFRDEIETDVESMLATD